MDSRQIISCLTALLLSGLVSCQKIYVQPAEEEPEAVPVEEVYLSTDEQLVGGYSAVLSCSIKADERYFVQGGFYYGTDPKLEDCQRAPGLISDNMLVVAVNDLVSDTTYYYQAYVTDKYDTVLSSIGSFKSPRFNLDSADFRISFKGDTFELAVETNEDFNVDLGGVDWITPDPSTKAIEKYRHKFVVSPNTKYESRSADLILSSPDGYFKKVVTVFQDEAPITIPDQYFKAYLLSVYDTDGDGELQQREFQRIVSIDISSDDIDNLKGIEEFPELRFLRCRGASTSGGRLSCLDLSVLPGLLYLDISNNPRIDALDLSSLPVLEELHCDACGLTSLELGKNPALRVLTCDSNRINTIHGSTSLALRHLSCEENALSELDIRRNTALQYLSFNGNEVKEISLINNAELDTLICDENLLETLYLRKNPKLRVLSCQNNDITSIGVDGSASLEDFRCNGNDLKLLDIDGCTSLRTLDCSSNQIESLDVSQCHSLTDLRCSCISMHTLYIDRNHPIEGIVPDRSDERVYSMTNILAHDDAVSIPDAAFREYLLKYYDSNKDGILSVEECTNVTQINVSGDDVRYLSGLSYFKNLKVLKCSGTRSQTGEIKGMLTSLDVSQNPLIEQLICDNNRITSLNLGNNAALRTLWCQYNSLTSLNVESNKLLQDLRCEGHRIGSLNLRANTALASLDCSPMADAQGNCCLKSVSLASQRINFINALTNRRNVSNIPSSTTLYTDRFSSGCMFNYNCRDYDSDTWTIKNDPDAQWDHDLVFNSSVSTASYNGEKCLYISLGQYFAYKFNTSAENPFNRDIKNNTLTIIAKVRGISTSYYSIFSNRGNDYNYMFREGDVSTRYFYLHDSRGCGQASYLTVNSLPNIVAARATSDNYIFVQSFTDGITGTKQISSWGNPSDGIALFAGDIYGGEPWRGYFYWIFVSLEELSDEEIQAVIDYNEKSQ